MSFGQERELNFMNISSKEGLSSNIVNTILKDKYGYMWFGTDDGLNKYDGQHFTIYRHKVTDSTSLISNEILCLYEDKEGNLWVGTGSGLVMYDRKLDSFINFPYSKGRAIPSICEDADGKIWVGTYDGLLMLNPKSKKFSALNLSVNANHAVLKQSILHIYRDRKNKIWLGTNTGLYLYLKNKRDFKRFFHSDSQPYSLVNNSIGAIHEDDKGHLWIGTKDGLSMLRSDEHSFLNYHYNSQDSRTLSSNIIYTIDSEPNDKIWIGTEEGLNILNPSNGKVTRVERDGRNNYGLIGKSVKSILIDSQGIYWVATYRCGINKYDKNLAFFNFVQSDRYDPHGLSAPIVTSFAQAKNPQEVYVGTDGGGLNLFDIKTGVSKHISINQTPNSKGLSILTMENVGSEIWIGTFLKGIFILDTKNRSVRQIIKGNGPNNLVGADVFAIKKDRNDNIWLGTNGQGVDFYSAKDHTFHHFINDKMSVNGYIRAIEEDNEGNIWIGSYGKGIAVYNPLTNQTLLLNKSDINLPSDYITSIYKANNGIIWVGTAGEGLCFYDQMNSKFVSFTEDDGLPNGFIYKILEDDNGKIWVSTNKGISCFDPRSKKFKNYSHYNGLQKSPFVLGAGIKLGERIFFGGTSGFNYFNPQHLFSNRNVPKIVLTDLKISNQSVHPSENAPINQDISIAKEIHLDYKQNFSLSFVALNYTSPQENQYAYKLENFDKDWNQVGSNNTAVYTNLDPGEYTFKVKASSEAGSWVTPLTTIKIVVNPPFWMTIYAYIFYVLLVFSILWYIRYRGIKKLKADFALEQERLRVQQIIEQERLEAERVHEFDQLKIKFLTNLSHEFRTPISLIMGPVEQLLQQETVDRKFDQLSMIRRNAKRLLNLVNQLLDFRNLKSQEQKLNLEEKDFIAFCRDVAESFKDLADRKQIHFEFHSSIKCYFTTFDPDKIERVLFNLLSNAFKFTKEGEIVLKIDRLESEEGIKLTLKDTGIGMEAREKDKIFERFFQTGSDAAILNQGSGIGLSITKEFVKMHNGTIEVESAVGMGSTFMIELPLAQVEDYLLMNDEEDLIDETIEVFSATPSDEPSIDAILPLILIVEDNEDLRFYLKDNLKSHYRIVEANNGKDAWQKVLSTHPELVLSDISMPHVSGIDLCRKIKSDKRTNHIPVLLLTALTGQEDQLLGLEIGANDYLTKPFNFEILNMKIRNLLTLNETLKATYSKRIKLTQPDLEIESDRDKLLAKMIQYIETNLTNPKLSVEDLSQHLGMSRGSLYTKVLEYTGESPVEFIRSVKLDKAAVLLEKSDMNISQISYSVGFATPNYFARAFKSRFNMLPSEYIQLKRNVKEQLAK